MNGELAQCLAIATHGSVWLADSRRAPSGPGGPLVVPLFVDLLAFDSVAGVDAWALRLADAGVGRLWLAVAGSGMPGEPGGPAPHLSAAFVGGVPVGLLSTGPAGNRLWRGYWQLGRRVADGAQIMFANYESQPVPDGPARVGVGAAAEELDRMLRRAGEFAERQRLPHWAGVFADARRHWAQDGTARQAGGPELFPASWPDADSRRLADMAQAAWVFGGMGSWNDLGFAGGDAQREYEQLSSDLFDAVMRACVAAVNVDWPSAR
jgi:hypothetical protein